MNRTFSEEDVRMLMLKLATTVPDEITLADMVPEFIRVTAAISDRITMQESSALIGAIAVLARACAAKDPATTCRVAIVQSETLQ